MFLNFLYIMIKAIIFDLGNVIVNVNHEKMFNGFAFKSNKSLEYIKDYYKNSSARILFEIGKIKPIQFYQQINKDLNLKIDFDNFCGIYCNIFTLNKDVANLIRRLKKDYMLILLSNTDELHFGHIKKKFKIVDIFDEQVLSYKVGHSKPNPLIFIKAIKKSGTIPFNCAYFDDVFEFVIVARLMGVKAFQFKNYKKLIQDLKKLKIL